MNLFDHTYYRLVGWAPAELIGLSPSTDIKSADAGWHCLSRKSFWRWAIQCLALSRDYSTWKPLDPWISGTRNRKNYHQGEIGMRFPHIELIVSKCSSAPSSSAPPPPGTQKIADSTTDWSLRFNSRRWHPIIIHLRYVLFLRLFTALRLDSGSRRDRGLCRNLCLDCRSSSSLPINTGHLFPSPLQ